MKDYILLMHDDCTSPVLDALWSSYFTKLQGLGGFDGGSAIGAGEVFREDGAHGPASDHLSGYIRVRAATLADAKTLLAGIRCMSAEGRSRSGNCPSLKFCGNFAVPGGPAAKRPKPPEAEARGSS